MGQYFKIIFLDSPKGNKIVAWYDCLGSKLTEHCYLYNTCVQKLESFLLPGACFHRKHVLWAGEYADSDETDPRGRNMSCIAVEDFREKGDGLYPILFSTLDEYWRQHYKHCMHVTELLVREYPYVVNHTLREYVNKYTNEDTSDIHPLPILCCEGNGRGGGDYKGTDMHLVGRWARHEISVEKTPPAGFTELKVNFIYAYR